MMRFTYKHHDQKDYWISVTFYYKVNLYTLLPFYHPDFKNAYFVHCNNTKIIKRIHGDFVYDKLLKREVK